MAVEIGFGQICCHRCIESFYNWYELSNFRKSINSDRKPNVSIGGLWERANEDH